MDGIIEDLFHYPIKGLSAQPLGHVTLKAGHGFPMDRAYGFARPGSGFDPLNPKPLPKTKFVVLARDADLATLATKFDPTRQILTIARDGTSAEFDLNTERGRDAAAGVLCDHLNFSEAMRPTLCSAHPHKFTDVSVVSPAMMNAVSLINIESVAHFSKLIGQDVSPARFRGNIVFSGLPALSELDMMGQTLCIGDVRMKLIMRTKRCPATEVNLNTGERDLNVPKLLREQFGHSDMGVYAEILQGGLIRPGDGISVIEG
ncbi:MAG: MOSC domain-containing protein [Aliishimia sp.]